MSFIYYYIMPSKNIIDIMKVSFLLQTILFLIKVFFRFFTRTPNYTWIFQTNMVESKRNSFIIENSLGIQMQFFFSLANTKFFLFLFCSLEVFSIKFSSILFSFCWMQWGIDKKIIKIENYRRLMEWEKSYCCYLVNEKIW